MPNPLTLRIVRWPFKLIYVVVAYGVPLGLFRLLSLLDVSGVAVNILSLILSIGAFVYGARVFRGRNEDVAAPRAWWRMTARRPLSKRLGVLFTVVASLELISILPRLLTVAGVEMGRLGATPDSTVPFAFATALFGILAFLYLNSARHIPKPSTKSDDPAARIDPMYEAFNARLAEQTASFLTRDVEWPNGWEGGYISGRREVIHYWERQWSQIDPVVTPTGIHVGEDGSVVVEVRQVVRDLNGAVLSDGSLQHVYRVRGDLFDRMEIRELPAKAGP